MASSASSNRPVHQEYIARIRYENPLPPPPGGVKLLEIPTPGMTYWASPAFTARMARQYPINIEADADLGMPIDLVGVPGIFDGDMSGKNQCGLIRLMNASLIPYCTAIMAPEEPPPIHPRDRNLLRPLSELGKPKYAPGGHSFLRRTEYISHDARAQAAAARAAAKAAPKLRRPDANQNDPQNVLANVEKGFNIAYPEDRSTRDVSSSKSRGTEPTPSELEAWNNPVHPSKSELRLVDSFPLLPDFSGFTDSAGYMVAKFTKNPTGWMDQRDVRLDVGLLKPHDLSEEAEIELQAKQAAHEADPLHVPVPAGGYDYDLFLPESEEIAEKIKQRLSITNPNRDNDALYAKKDAQGAKSFCYDNFRIFETARQVNSAHHPYKDVVIALHDPDVDPEQSRSAGLEKAAYYYPVLQKMQLKPKRQQDLARIGLSQVKREEDDKDKLDAIELQIKEPDEMEVERRESHRADLEIDAAGEVD